jgi:hypothetical protein
MRVIRLTKAKNLLGERSLNNVLSSFSCEKDLNVQRFLQRSALAIDAQNLSATHLCFSNDYQLIGYFTLMVKQFFLHDDVSNSIRRKVGARDDNFSCYLIAQLGRSDRFKGIVKGSVLIDQAIELIYYAQKYVGMKCACVEYTPIPALRDFYGASGFQDIQFNPETANMLAYRKL